MASDPNPAVLLVNLSRRGGVSRYVVPCALVAKSLGRCRAVVREASEGHEWLSRAGDGVEIICLRGVRRFPSLSWPVVLLRLVAVLGRLRDTNIVHLCSEHPFHLVPAIAARLLGRRVLLTVHDATPHLGEHSRLWSLSTAALRASVGEFVTHSRYVGDELGRRRQRRDGRPIHRVGLPNLLPVASIPPRRPTMARHFAFVGRIQPYKGVDVLLDAFESLLREVPDATLTIAGEVSPGMVLKRTVRNVVWRLEWLSIDAMVEIYQRCDVVVLPYREASQSGTIAEAVSCGAFVLATPVGGLVEQVRQHPTRARVARGASAADLSEAMRELAMELPHGTQGTEERWADAYAQILRGTSGSPPEPSRAGSAP